jgi:uncharacterized membrane protein
MTWNVTDLRGSALIGAVAGLRSLMSPALVSGTFSQRAPRSSEPLRQLLARRWVRRGLRTMALGELLADKHPRLPNRTAPPALLARAVSGAVAAAASCPRRASKVDAAIVGGLSAVVASFAARGLRRIATTRLGLPDPLVALVEDGFAYVVGSSVVNSAA